MDKPDTSVFREQYRVVAVQSDCLLLRGTISGHMVTVVNGDPRAHISPDAFPVGKLIALTDPSKESAELELM
jgi:hypothetical protein